MFLDIAVLTNGYFPSLPPTGRPFFTKHPEELKGDFTRASLVKSVRGLGFTIVGGNHRDTQFLQIKNVVENGPAYLSGKLRTGRDSPDVCTPLKQYLKKKTMISL